MDKNEQKIFNYITKNEGFYMNQYRSSNGRDDKWIGLKKLNEGLYAVVVTDEKDEDSVQREANEYLKTIGEKYNLHIIVLSNIEYFPSRNESTSKVIVNIKEKKITYCDVESQSLGNIVMHLLVKEKETRESKTMIVTICIIGINIILFLVSAFMSKNIMNIDGQVLLDLGGKFGPLIDQGEVYRLVTSNFLHGGIIHLAFNMYALYSIGPQIEELYGRTKYICIYFLTGIGSSFLSYYMLPNTLSIGASGSIFGLLGVLLIFAVRNRNSLNKGAIGNLVMVIGVNLYIGITLPNIDNYGHVGGLIVGIIMGIISLGKGFKTR
jgi:rhomboid protease GluP